ncbi:malto-oligosyltrehalose synthase [Leptolyngbya ohadii]|uniref:malto-oligosyltrehalose synthase n=1 Tax=Leptolyngbya ohadii TaxID=1962290 RepID=UPI0021F1D772|nr:malto-oligosyltrehalose synthase [Leptolyngbya ohadii]
MMRIPLATYRLQFTPDFQFSHAQAIVPYLAELGISDLYASPILTARKGSTHGYDAVNPKEISPHLGGMEAFDTLIQELKPRNMGWLQDIVPNHMAFDSQNYILVDVVENGPDSQYHDYFDIDWNHPYEGLKGRVLAPFLGKFYGDCLESGELQLKYGETGLSINYYALSFPIRIESYSHVLMHNLSELREKLGRDNPDFVKLLGVLYMVRYIPSGAERRERYEQITFIKRMLWELWNDSPEVKEFIENNIQTFNGEVGNAASFDRLDKLLSEQFFRLSYWKVGNEELNYRRFFTVNDLIAMRVEEKHVFDTTHSFILKLVEEGKFTGLRIDHIDGLYHPVEYINRLREKAPDVYLVVEKILEPHEDLPLNWAIQGTTGYDFMSKVNCLFSQQSSEADFDAIYQSFIGETVSSEEIIDEKKRLIIGKHLAGDIDNLAVVLKQISERYRYTSDFTMYGLKRALVEVLAMFPVYRTYVSPEGFRKTDRECLRDVIDKAKEKIPNFTNELSFIEKCLLLESDANLPEEEKQLWLRFLMRMQQFTGPLMAKGVEDTAMYAYNRLVSLNEVGSSIAQFGISIDEFHAYNQNRASRWPHAMSGTATHDTKRGEDVRARLNVLSELPQEWEHHLRNWHAINAPLKDTVEGLDAPAHNDEYFLYQTLLGAYPFDPAEHDSFIDRVKEYVIKACRESKVHSSWQLPDSDYEKAYTDFVDRILKNTDDNLFLQEFRPFQRKIQHYGICNSLSQTLLKMTAPGVPDFYQGTELWDLSLVDPDNRRPVDYEKRHHFLKDIKAQIDSDLPGLVSQLLKSPDDGRIKLFLIHQVLKARHAYAELFQRGTYEPIPIVGSLKGHLVAFMRELSDTRMIVIAPRFPTAIIKEGEYPIGESVWHETRLLQPPGSTTVWHDLITGREIDTEETIWIKETLTQFPVALLVSEEVGSRGVDG